MSQMDRKVRGKVAKKLKEILQPSINEEGMKIRSTGETKSLISSVLIENCPPSKLFSLQQLCRELSEGLTFDPLFLSFNSFIPGIETVNQ